MEKVYTNRMAKKNAPGRPFYDKLLLLPKFGRCPLCGQRKVSTIDHYLPKAYYPALVVSPINLVPSCKDCNTIKLGKYATCSEEETLHPYFDDIDNEQWLFAEVLKTSPPSISFFVSSHSSWSELLKKRVQYHFHSLELSALYSSHAAEELTNIKFILNKLLESSGSSEVREHLLDSEESYYQTNRNSWQTAMYNAIAKCHWYYSGGFNNFF